LGIFTFREEAVGSRSFGLLDGLLGIVYRENQNLRLWPMSQNLSEGSQSVKARHVDIKNDQVGLQSFGFFNRFLSIDRFAANF